MMIYHSKYKVIFLDIDGVLNSELWARFCYNRRHKRKHKHNNLLCPYLINKLAKYCKNHNIKLIISSSWRCGSYNKTIEDFQRYKQLNPILEYIIGVTPYCEDRMRGHEIDVCMQILNDNELYNKYKVLFKERFIIENYVIIDDDNDMLQSQLNNFVQTSFWDGLSKKHYKNINKIFNI